MCKYRQWTLVPTSRAVRLDKHGKQRDRAEQMALAEDARDILLDRLRYTDMQTDTSEHYCLLWSVSLLESLVSLRYFLLSKVLLRQVH